MRREVGAGCAKQKAVLQMQEMARTVDAIHASRPARGHDRVLVPGDRAAETRERRRVSGVPLDDAIVDMCEALAASTSVPFPTPMQSTRG